MSEGEGTCLLQNRAHGRDADKRPSDTNLQGGIERDREHGAGLFAVSMWLGVSVTLVLR